MEQQSRSSEFLGGFLNSPRFREPCKTLASSKICRFFFFYFFEQKSVGETPFLKKKTGNLKEQNRLEF